MLQGAWFAILCARYLKAKDGRKNLKIPATRWGARQSWFVLLLIECTVLLVCRNAVSAEIVAVLSSDASPYESAYEALQKKLSSTGHTLRSVQLKDFDEETARKALTDASTCFVAIGSDAAVALHKRIPANCVLVYCMVADPGQLGLTSGRATSGVDTTVPLKTQLELIAGALPKSRTVGLLYRSDSPESTKLRDAVKNALPAGWALEAVAADKIGSMSKAVDTLFERKIDVVWTAPDSVLYDQAAVRSLLLASLRRKIPVFGYSLAFVKAGALLGVGIEPQAQGRQVAEVLERVRSGKVSGVAVEAPEFGIAVNLIVAERISITLPEKFVSRAQQVIKGK